MRKSWIKWLLALLVLVGLAAWLAWAIAPRPVAVELTTIARGTVKVEVVDEGKARYRDVYAMTAPARGHLQRIELEVGDKVEAGETVVARIVPVTPELLDIRSRQEQEAKVRAAEAAVAAAEAEEERARALAENAKRDFDRQERLALRGAASESAFDIAQREMRATEAALAAAIAAVSVREAELTASRTLLDEVYEPAANGSATDDPPPAVLALRAPVSGVVLRIPEKSSRPVAPGDAILDIGDPNRLEVVADFLSQDAVRIAPGYAASIIDWGMPDPLPGSVRLVEPVAETEVSALGIEEQRANVLIDPAGELAAWKRLGHGYEVRARITVDERQDVLVVPVGALFRRDTGWAVYRVEDGTAHLADVTLGALGADVAEIRGGLAEGDLVVLFPSNEVDEGVEVVEARDADE
ncbi:efflux RND transporter periplasmic adaptor subunit [Afifella pfennigii]|uniref:efflux RND transporter periplasmic adaptor subunit n=1 Tax=Afifella pfennigii TaxID=209897 RepID=UPI00047D0A4E|nr:HlyD family efflux transporter periplasmic adaptor subunit [Afifella pfennigii]